MIYLGYDFRTETNLQTNGKGQASKKTHTRLGSDSLRSQRETHMHRLKVVLESMDLADHWKLHAVFSCRSRQIPIFPQANSGWLLPLTTRIPILYPCLMVGSSIPERLVSPECWWIPYPTPDQTSFLNSIPDTQAPKQHLPLSYPMKSSSSWCSRHHHFLYSLPPYKSVQRYPSCINEWHCFCSYRKSDV